MLSHVNDTSRPLLLKETHYHRSDLDNHNDLINYLREMHLRIIGLPDNEYKCIWVPMIQILSLL